jgi:DNA-binding MurR/RpiR family transcriptional regulator
MTARKAKLAASLQERVTALEGMLSPSERTVARYLADHPEIAATANSRELGQRTGRSNATVVRTVKSLGYAGLNDLKHSLLKVMVDRVNPAAVLTQQLDRLAGENAASKQILRASADLLTQAGQLLDEVAWQESVDIVDRANSVLCYGVEQAGSIAYYLSLQLIRSGKQSRALTDTGIGVANGLLTLAAEDAVVIIAPLRYFREIDVVLIRARQVGAPVVLITEALRMALEDRVDVVLQTPQSTPGLASEITVPLVLARALSLEIAGRHRSAALESHSLLNRLRATAAGGEVDVDRSTPNRPRRQTPRRRPE